MGQHLLQAGEAGVCEEALEALALAVVLPVLPVLLLHPGVLLVLCHVAGAFRG
jgi:hypothetical protein